MFNPKKPCNQRNIEMRRVLIEKFGKYYKAKKFIRRKNNGKCWICNQIIEWSDFSIDHVIESSAGGTNDLSNLMPAHKQCNTLRSIKTNKQCGKTQEQ